MEKNFPIIAANNFIIFKIRSHQPYIKSRKAKILDLIKVTRIFCGAYFSCRMF